MTRIILISLLLFSIGISISAQEKKADIKKKEAESDAAQAQQKTMADKFKEVNDKVYKLMTKIPAPIVSYSTETSWLFGLAKFNAFDLNKKDTISKASSIGGTVGMALEGQLFLALGGRFHFTEDKNVIETSFRAEKFPREFWGVGNDINIDNSELVTKTFLMVDLTYKRMIFKNTYIGINYNYMNVFDVEYDLSKDIYAPEVYEGNKGGVNSGFGLVASYDTRDNIYNSTKGMLFEIQSSNFNNIIGSDFIFNRYTADLRFFKKIFKNNIIAYQVYTQSNYGSVPVYSMALMGGTDRMRGFYEGQYRNNTIIDTQLEFRTHLFWLIGGVVFISAGQVSESYTYFSISQIKYAAGGGLRILVDKEHNTNLRFDIGFGHNTSALFFGFSEAF